MPSKQGDLSLLDHPIAQELLHSTIPARLSYTWRDGTPRVVPIWFHWNGEEQGRAWVEQVRAMSLQMVRIAVRPTWVGFLDFETRFPSAIEAAMAGL